MSPESIFVELECACLTKDGESVCGDEFQCMRLNNEERTIAVLSDGLGSGIKASLLANMTSTMALSFVRSNMDILQSAETIMDTLPVCEVRKISYATFTIFDVLIGGSTRVVEMGNPPFIHLRNNCDLNCERRVLVSDRWPDRQMEVSQLKVVAGDRLIAFSDGVTQAGLGRVGNKFGWRREGALEFIQGLVTADPAISARELSQAVVTAARRFNHDGKCHDDTSCMVMYLRRPRWLRLLSGPPFHEKNDADFARLAQTAPGKVIIAGGTTANLISRELQRPVEVDLKLAMKAGKLPPPAKMRDIDLVSEGILTLTETAQRLESGNMSGMPLAAQQMIDLLLDSDVIEMIIGTRVNEAHQDPSLPMDLDIRRNMMRRLKDILESKYRKTVITRYF